MIGKIASATILSVSFVVTLITNNTSAQVQNTATLDTTSTIHIGNISIGGYLDMYYGFSFNEPADGDIPYFVSSARHNEATINLAYIDVQYKSERLRGRLAPGFGTYVNSNYAAEPGTLKNLIEASIGVRLSAKRNIWLDAGVLGSPYTNESAISKDHLMYTRSLAPEYVPYYLSGLKLSVPLNRRLNAYLYILNGWQQIQDLNSSKSAGTQIEYRPNNKNLLNWNTYIGDESNPAKPGRGMRYFSDVFWINNPEGKLSLTSCAYIGYQQLTDSLGNSAHREWWQVNLIGRYRINSTSSVSARIEYFSDPFAVMIVPVSTIQEGFSTYSGSLCYNYQLSKNSLFRLEGRQFFSDRNVFVSKSGADSRQMTWLVSSLCLWF